MSHTRCRSAAFYLGLTGLALCAVLAPATASAVNKQSIGWVEPVILYPGAIHLRARIDTGAKTASVNATHIQRFTRHGQPWLRFTITGARGRAVTLTRRQIQTVHIKRHGQPPVARPVVVLAICLAGVRKPTLVGLANRSQFNYPLLVGRRFLEGAFIVDPGQTFVTRPHCAL